MNKDLAAPGRVATAATYAATPTVETDKFGRKIWPDALLGTTAGLFYPTVVNEDPETAKKHAISLCDKLDLLNERFAVAMIEGKTVVLDLFSSVPPDYDLNNRAIVDSVIPRAIPCAVEFESFRKLYLDQTESVHTKKAAHRENIADIWLKWPGHTKYTRGIIFAPGMTQDSVGPDHLNIFTGWGMPPAEKPNRKADEASCSEFLHHLKYVLCSGDKEIYDWLLWWMADIVQNPMPASLPGSAVVLAGKKGTGKTLVTNVLRKIIGIKYFARATKKKDLVGEFNAHLATALLVNCEEVTFGGDIESNDTLKDMITGDIITMNQKFMPKVTMKSYSRFIFTTNHDYSHNTSEDERRYLFLDVGSQHMNDTPYFKKIADQLEDGGYQGFANILHTMEKPEGVNLRKPPKTEAHARLFAQSLSVEERFFYNALVTGDGYPEEALDEAGTVFVSDLKRAFDSYLDEQGKSRSFKRSDNNFIPACMQRFWGMDPETQCRKVRNRKKETCYEVPSLARARERATWSPTEDGLGLSKAAVGLDSDDEETED